MKSKILCVLSAIVVISCSAAAKVSAQSRIDAVVKEFVDNNDSNSNMSYRSVVKRDPKTNEIIKRVTELYVTNKDLARRLINAFEAETKTAEGVDINRGSSFYNATLVWSNPKRVYEISCGGGGISFSSLTEYQKAK